MTIDRAIELLHDLNTTIPFSGYACDMAVVALKRVQECRDTGRWAGGTLPHETYDEWLEVGSDEFIEAASDYCRNEGWSEPQ